jgi:hypothetical protein
MLENCIHDEGEYLHGELRAGESGRGRDEGGSVLHFDGLDIRDSKQERLFDLVAGVNVVERVASVLLLWFNDSGFGLIVLWLERKDYWEKEKVTFILKVISCVA